MGVLVMDGSCLASATFPSAESSRTDPWLQGPLSSTDCFVINAQVTYSRHVSLLYAPQLPWWTLLHLGNLLRNECPRNLSACLVCR